MTRISSAKYLRGSKDATCKLRIICDGMPGDPTVVPCHIRDKHTGRGIKASDISVLDGCHRCHEIFDRRGTMPDGSMISREDWLFYALRGLQETLEARHEAGLLIVPLDEPKPPKVKPRKPKTDRQPIPKRPFPKSSKPWPKRQMRKA